MARIDALGIRQALVIVGICLLTLVAIVAVSVTARVDPSTQWVGRAAVTVLLLCLLIVGYIAAPEDALSVWGRLSRGLVLWASTSWTRSAGTLVALVSAAAVIWTLGPLSVHQLIVYCNGASQLRSALWDGTLQVAPCKELATLSMWRPFRRTASAQSSVSCHAAGIWSQPTPGGSETELQCPKSIVTANDAQAFEVYSQDTSLDLTGWQLVPSERAEEKLSQGKWTSRTKVRRSSSDVDSFCIRHASSGLPTPDFVSSTHLVSVNETTERPLGGPRPRLRIFDVCFDVSGEPANNWFDVQLSSTYWNAFNNDTSGWAAMPLPHGARTATFTIQFPTHKRPTEWERREGSRDTTTSELVTDNAIQVADGQARFRWTVHSPRKNWVYRFEWKW